MTPARHPARSGFTLLEVMFVVGVMALLSATVLATFASLGRTAAEMTGYRGKQAGARHALDVIARDIRQARSVTAGAQASNPLTVKGPEAQVLYILEDGVLSRHDANPAHRLCIGVTGMRVELLTHQGQPATDAGSVALVRTTLEVVETGRGPRTTSTFSLATAMRNREAP